MRSMLRVGSSVMAKSLLVLMMLFCASAYPRRVTPVKIIDSCWGSRIQTKNSISFAARAVSPPVMPVTADFPRTVLSSVMATPLMKSFLKVLPSPVLSLLSAVYPRDLLFFITFKLTYRRLFKSLHRVQGVVWRMLSLGQPYEWESSIIGFAEERAGLLVKLIGGNYIAKLACLVISKLGFQLRPNEFATLLSKVSYSLYAANVIDLFKSQFMPSFFPGIAENKRQSYVANRSLSVIIWIFAFLIVLDMISTYLNIPLSSTLAFGGVGGLAIGLSARDVAANLLGGMMLLFNEPFTPGDMVTFRTSGADLIGRVERVGWGQTRIRGLDTRPTYVPNSHFVSTAVTNMERITHRRVEAIVPVRFQDHAVMPEIISRIKERLRTIPKLDTLSMPFRVSFYKFGQYCLEIQIICFFATKSIDEFLTLQQAANMEVVRAIIECGAELALPTTLLQTQAQFPALGINQPPSPSPLSPSPPLSSASSRGNAPVEIASAVIAGGGVGALEGSATVQPAVPGDAFVVAAPSERIPAASVRTSAMQQEDAGLTEAGTSAVAEGAGVTKPASSGDYRSGGANVTREREMATEMEMAMGRESKPQLETRKEESIFSNAASAPASATSRKTPPPQDIPTPSESSFSSVSSVPSVDTWTADMRDSSMQRKQIMREDVVEREATVKSEGSKQRVSAVSNDAYSESLVENDRREDVNVVGEAEEENKGDEHAQDRFERRRLPKGYNEDYLRGGDAFFRRQDAWLDSLRSMGIATDGKRFFESTMSELIDPTRSDSFFSGDSTRNPSRNSTPTIGAEPRSTDSMTHELISSATDASRHTQGEKNEERESQQQHDHCYHQQQQEQKQQQHQELATQHARELSGLVDSAEMEVGETEEERGRVVFDISPEAVDEPLDIDQLDVLEFAEPSAFWDDLRAEPARKQTRSRVDAGAADRDPADGFVDATTDSAEVSVSYQPAASAAVSASSVDSAATPVEPPGQGQWVAYQVDPRQSQGGNPSVASAVGAASVDPMKIENDESREHERDGDGNAEGSADEGSVVSSATEPIR